MTANVIRTITRALQVLWLRWEIDSAEQWIKACERDGIVTTEMLRYQRRHVSTLYVRLASLERGAMA